MENWGLITYRESVLIYDPSFNSYSQQEVTVVDIAHELAHM
jgi:aminopeptidase N